MCTPSVTLRSLKNEDTGIDISVPRFKEEEAPLGGISILYEITVLTRLDLFKTRLHKSGDIVHFTIFKAYREIEELYNKLNKKYPKAGLPPVPQASSAGKYTCEEKVEALDTFMSAIARNVQICYSSIFTQFIGINSQRLPSFSLPKSESDSSDVNVDSSTQEKTTPENKKETDDSEMFPKMKNVSTVKEQPASTTVKKVDLFDEEKLNKQSKHITSTGTTGGLFDDFEDADLFSSKPVEKVTKKEVAPAKETTKQEKSLKKPEIPKKKEASTEHVDDSQIIIQNRKLGDMSLFKEQDFGGFITKDEESLFLVTSPNSKNKKNVLLFSEDDVLSPDSDHSLNENLDDLLNLEPLPITSVSSKKLEIESFEEVPSEEPPKPQPRLRNKSLEESDSSAQPKPEVMPRKIFLDKPNVPTKPKPAPPPIAAKPQSSSALQSKPPPPPKPKLPPKKPKPNENPTKDLDAINANKSENTDNLNTVSNLANELKELDILKYIEQEEKSLDSELNLFD